MCEEEGGEVSEGGGVCVGLRARRVVGVCEREKGEKVRGNRRNRNR